MSNTTDDKQERASASEPAKPRSLERLVGPLSDSGEEAMARISHEHGWLCVRNEHGWLLFTAKCSEMPMDGLLLSGVLEEAAESHERWVEDKRSNDPDWPNAGGETRRQEPQ